MQDRSFRKCDISSGNIDEKERTVDISFSSEEPVERMWGMEILDHSEGSADLSRLNNKAAVFVDHDGDQIGVVKSASINSSEKRGYAKIKFSKSVRGQEVFQDIIDGIRTNISFGYVIDKESMEKESDRTFRVKRWTPYEISVVGVPADATIGIGRSSEVKTETKTEEVPEVLEVKQEEVKIEIKKEDLKMEVDAGKKRVDEIFAIAEKHPELMKEAREAVKNDMPLEDFQKLTIERLYPNAKKVEIPATSKPMLTEKEVKKYSLMNVIRSQAFSDTSLAGFEREVSQELAKKSGRTPKGIMVPNEAMLTRAYTDGLNVTNDADGGYTVATELKADQLIPLLRNKMVCLEAGVNVMSGLVGDIVIPKQTGGATCYWAAEGSGATISKAQFGSVTLSPSLLTAYSKFTRSMIIQSSLGVEAMVKNDLNTVRALELDRAILKGSGSGAEPEGIITNSSVPTVALGTNGAAFTFAKIVDMETEVAQDNADIGSLAYIFNAKTRGRLKTTEKATNTAQFIWEPGNTVNGYKALVTNQLPSDLTKAGGSALSCAVFGNFNDVILGAWGGIDVLVNPYEEASTGGFLVYIYQNVDIQLRHTESFCKVVDIVTT